MASLSGDMLLVGIILLLMATSSLQDQCFRGVHLEVRSSRNQTGHWNTLILWDQDVSQDIEMDNRETGPVAVNINQRVRGCSSTETVSMEARFHMPPQRSAPGYGLVPGVGRYKFHAKPETWETARKICFSEGGHLAVVRSKAQEEALKEMFTHHLNIENASWDGAAWLGLTDQHSEGDFITVLGESLPHIGYNNWEPGKPDNKVWAGFTTDSDCGAFLRSGMLVDFPCTALYAFFCERDITMVSPSGEMLIVGIIILLVATSSLQDQCSRAVHLEVRSSRNQTGHWNTLILWDQDVSQDIEMDNRETGPVLVNISQRVRGCSSTETVSMEARFHMPPPRSAPGYGLVPGVGRYKFHAKPETWETARKICFSEGGHLAVVRSKTQEEALKEMFTHHLKIEKTTWDGAAWLGLTDQHSEGDFITVLGESFSHVGYANWISGKPDSRVWDGFKTDSDCGAFLRSGQLIDLPCSDQYAFFCEQNI
ncbi:uncharacterized protein [Anabrus simplex]|uniref:uncharacterized protein n=1 Tax=Anabrus simplex TaxID=316456 RepID=UPI0035A3A6D6